MELTRRPVIHSEPGLPISYDNRQHVEMFPNHRGLPLAAIKELKDTFAHGLCGAYPKRHRIIWVANDVLDYVTSQTSMFAYDPDTIEKLTKCMAGMKGAYSVGTATRSESILTTMF